MVQPQNEVFTKGLGESVVWKIGDYKGLWSTEDSLIQSSLDNSYSYYLIIISFDESQLTKYEKVF